MVNWLDISSDFNEELIKEWENKGFSCEEARDWANSLGSVFNPQDYEFIDWLKNNKGKNAEEVLNHGDAEELRQEFKRNLQREKERGLSVYCDQCQKYIGDDKLLYFSDAEKNLELCSKKCYLEYNRSWEDIHKDFSKDSGWEVAATKQKLNWQQLWKGWGFTVEEIKQLVDTGLCPREAYFGRWLKNKKQTNSWLILDTEKLRREYQQPWINIHEDFGKFAEKEEHSWSDKTFQQLWEENKLTYQNAQEWIIPVGFFEPKDYWKIKQWKESGYSSQQAQEWTQAGFDYYYQIKEWKNHNFTPQEAKFWTEVDFNPYRGDLDRALEWKKEFAFEQVKELIELGFPLFDLQFAKKWKDLGFSFEKIKEWVKVGLKPYEVSFANHLKQNNHQPNQLTTNSLFQLRKEFYPGYPRAQSYLEKNYPCNCRGNQIIHQENCPRKALYELNLRNLNLEGDLDLKGFIHLDNYFKDDNSLKVHLAGNPNLGAIKNKPSWMWLFGWGAILVYQNPQEWLNQNYSNKEKVEKIDLSDLGFEQSSELIIDNYPNLKKIRRNIISYNSNLTKLTISNCPQLKKINVRELESNQQLTLNNLPKLKELMCWGNKLTSLDLTACPNLQKIYCHGNQLTEIKLPQGEKLEWLDLSFNKFHQDLSFLKDSVNLREVWLYSNKFYGSLEFLKDLKKLETLNIDYTDINSGLEYLPENVELFYCSGSYREDPIQTLYKLFADDRGVVETEKWRGYIKNFPQKLKDYKDLFVTVNSKSIKNFPQKFHDYKQWRKLNFSEEEIKQWINAGATLNDYNLYQRWEKQNFTLQEAKQWVKAGAKARDYEFISWLRDVKKETPEWITNYKEDYKILSERFEKYGLCFECNQPNTGEQWCQGCNKSRLEIMALPASNNPKINEFIQKYQLAATDADKFIEWIPYEQFTELEKIKESELQAINSELQVLNSEYEDLKKSKFKQLLNWNKKKELEEKISNYSSQVEELTNEIEKRKYNESDIEYLAEGGFGKVYKAKWPVGNIHHWEYENKQWYRKKDNGKDYREVVLKILDNSQNNTDFLQETEKHKIIDDWFNNIVPCYGLSQDPQTENYLMVMKYMPEGNLRHYLSNKNKELTLEDKLSQLLHIAQGLKDIHTKKLVHRDFHSGNILKGIEKTSCLITDLGLCKPANETNKEDKIFGVMPYVAPEVLRSQSYTQAADIYSFGIIAYELLSGLPPYYDRAHDKQLGVEICQGLRPQFQIKVPQLLENLIKRCWNAGPGQRPTASELERILRKWQEEINGYGDTKFKSQLQEAEGYNKNLPNDIKFPKYEIHSGASYHSKLLPTKEITKLLKNLEINPSLIDDETKELVREIIRVERKILANAEDEQARNDIKEFNKKLKVKGLIREEIAEIIQYCKKQDFLEKQQTEKKEMQLEAKIQQTNLSPFNKNS